MPLHELVSTSPVVVAFVAGLFGILDLRMKKRFEKQQQYVDPIKEQVVNGHSHVNLRAQLDQLEFQMQAHLLADKQMLDKMDKLESEFREYRSWAEVENQRQWKEIARKGD